MGKYVAFLRGINVGGNKKVPMVKLKRTFENLGFENVRTLLASGNVIFEGKRANLASLVKKISATLGEAFGFTIPVILLDTSEIKKMIESNPFKKIEITSQKRFYVTFLSAEPQSKLKIPYINTDNSFSILSIEGNAVFSVLDLAKTGTPEAMGILEKEFGKNITTRNWNTIIKILKK